MQLVGSCDLLLTYRHTSFNSHRDTKDKTDTVTDRQTDRHTDGCTDLRTDKANTLSADIHIKININITYIDNIILKSAQKTSSYGRARCRGEEIVNRLFGRLQT